MMGSLVLDLQREVLKSNCDTLNALRKAHLIATKLKLKEFDSWVQNELNGYKCTYDDIPEYRDVRGIVKLHNPLRGWISAPFEDEKEENRLSHRKVFQSISEIIAFSNGEKTPLIYFPGSVSQDLSQRAGAPIVFEAALFITQASLNSIVEKVKNCLLEWTIRLEAEGILGEDMHFSQEETNMAKEIPQQINNYYGTVVNGDVSQSQVVSGNHNSIVLNYGQASDLMKKVKDSIEQEQLSEEDYESAMELISEAENKIAAQKNPRIIQVALSGLRDFLVAGGANVTAALIVHYLQTLG